MFAVVSVESPDVTLGKKAWLAPKDQPSLQISSCPSLWHEILGWKTRWNLLFSSGVTSVWEKLLTIKFLCDEYVNEQYFICTDKTLEDPQLLAACPCTYAYARGSQSATPIQPRDSPRGEPPLITWSRSTGSIIDVDVSTLHVSRSSYVTSIIKVALLPRVQDRCTEPKNRGLRRLRDI